MPRSLASAGLFVRAAGLALLSACTPDPRRPAPPVPQEETAAPARAPTVPATVPAATTSPTPPEDAPARAEAPPDLRKRIVSIGQTTWIRRRPAIEDGTFLGYVRTGSSIPLRSEDLVRGPGCSGGFYQVAPRGYVCRDRTVTETPRPAWMEAAEAARGGPGVLPYQYAFSNGAPMYNRVPTAKEQERFEKFLGKPGTYAQLPKTLRSHEELAVERVTPATDPLPPFLSGRGSAREAPYDLVEQTIPLGSMLSYTRAFEAEGRTWLLSADHTIVPADRVRPFRPSSFQGVDLTEGDVKLPIAWMRVKARPKYTLRGEEMTATGEVWPVRTFVPITGATHVASGRAYLETRESVGEAKLYVAADDATTVEPEVKLPHGVRADQRWFLIRITKGTLVAYDGLEPTYATLVSPGAGGVPVPGRDPVKDSTTPLGTYTITFKDRAATMSPEKGKDRSFWIADVPHTQYFAPPFALHAAYWHERFGELVSAGCVNLSPIDAARLFAWSHPHVPEEWQGATGAGAKENGQASAVVIRR